MVFLMDRHFFSRSSGPRWVITGLREATEVGNSKDGPKGNPMGNPTGKPWEIHGKSMGKYGLLMFVDDCSVEHELEHQLEIVEIFFTCHLYQKVSRVSENYDHSWRCSSGLWQCKKLLGEVPTLNC